MEELEIIADLSDIDVSFIYKMNSISDDGTPLIGDVSNEYFTKITKKTIEEVDNYFKQFGIE